MNCELTTAAAEGGVEVFAAPDAEPLASCAFHWADGWSGHGFEWQPPGLGGVSPLFCLISDDGRLDVEVARFGCEVDGLAFAQRVWPDLEDGHWRGLPIAAGRRGEAEVRVVHSGPALHLLTARGDARLHVDRAAATLRSLSGRGPNSEPLEPLQIGPFQSTRLAAWTAETAQTAQHGHHGVNLLAELPTQALGAQLRARVVDRRVHVGVDPEALLDLEDSLWAELPLVLEPPRGANGPEGPYEERAGRFGGEAVEWRRALRQVGPSVIVLTGLWPSFERAPVLYLNGRRHFDIVLTVAQL